MIIYDRIYKRNGLSKTQQEIINLIGSQKTVLEIGSSTGYMTRFLLQNKCIVDVVEKNNKAIPKLPKGIRKIINISIEDNKIGNLISSDYDFIVLADVLEHLVDPEKTLKNLCKVASKYTRLIISLPNIASWVMRKQLFFHGDFQYQESGILDKTHLHFYTVNTLPKILLENGWKTEQIIGTITRFPIEETIKKLPIIGLLFKSMFYKRLVEKYKNLSYYHFLIIATKDVN